MTMNETSGSPIAGLIKDLKPKSLTLFERMSTKKFKITGAIIALLAGSAPFISTTYDGIVRERNEQIRKQKEEKRKYDELISSADYKRDILIKKFETEKKLDLQEYIALDSSIQAQKIKPLVMRIDCDRYLNDVNSSGKYETVNDMVPADADTYDLMLLCGTYLNDKKILELYSKRMDSLSLQPTFGYRSFSVIEPAAEFLSLNISVKDTMWANNTHFQEHIRKAYDIHKKYILEEVLFDAPPHRFIYPFGGERKKNPARIETDSYYFAKHIIGDEGFKSHLRAALELLIHGSLVYDAVRFYGTDKKVTKIIPEEKYGTRMPNGKYCAYSLEQVLMIDLLADCCQKNLVDKNIVLKLDNAYNINIKAYEGFPEYIVEGKDSASVKNARQSLPRSFNWNNNLPFVINLNTRLSHPEIYNSDRDVAETKNRLMTLIKMLDTRKDVEGLLPGCKIKHTSNLTMMSTGDYYAAKCLIEGEQFLKEMYQAK